jgi:putative DNA primase/helicase
MSWDNYAEVVQQLDALLTAEGRTWKTPTEKDSLRVDGRRHGFGKRGTCWYRLHTFAPRNSSRTIIVGAFGSWKSGKVFKVEWDRDSLSKESLEAYRHQQQQAREQARREAEEAAALAAMTAGELWGRAVRVGHSQYLERKGLEPEACRFLAEKMVLGRRDPNDKPIYLPAGTLVLPLIRYDLPREEALRGLQFIKPDGGKVFTEGFAKSGCAIRLGTVDDTTGVILVCEGYATGLSIRLATGRRWPVFVALDAYNLQWVVEILRALYPPAHLLICADDDWKTKDHDGANPGRRKAWKVAKTTPGCEIVWPVFDPARRQLKDTDFNDLHLRQGLPAVERQLVGVLSMIEERREACGA